MEKIYNVSVEAIGYESACAINRAIKDLGYATSISESRRPFVEISIDEYRELVEEKNAKEIELIKKEYELEERIGEIQRDLDKQYTQKWELAAKVSKLEETIKKMEGDK